MWEQGVYLRSPYSSELAAFGASAQNFPDIEGVNDCQASQKWDGDGEDRVTSAVIGSGRSNENLVTMSHRGSKRVLHR